MTKLTTAIARETQALVKHKGKLRPVIVELDRSTITLRLKGIRSRGVTIALDRLFTQEEGAAARRAVGL
jgi:hypothetical protein